VIAAASAIQSHLSSHPSSVSQRAAVYALGNDASVESTIGEMVRTFRQRRDAICLGLNAIDGVSCPVPDGAFYVFPDVRGLFGRPLGDRGTVVQSSNELAAYLLDEALVSAVPGEAFGVPGFIRFSYALSMDELNEGVQRMQRTLAPTTR
jgi:aspartate/methionine/tyrosine aminotransferase